MKKKVLASVLVLLVFSGCVQQAPSATSDMSADAVHESSSQPAESEENMPENSESVAEVGVNGMTEEEILELLMRKVNEANEIDSWIFYDCFEDFDENSEGIYDEDDMSPEGFYWHPSARFETRQALYDYMGTVFRPMGVPGDLDWMFGEEIWGVEGDGGKAVYKTVFKEIDGRLHVRDSGRWGERRKLFDYDFETAVVLVSEETEGEIAVDVHENPEIVVGGERFHLWLENSHWVISKNPTLLYGKWK